MYNKIDLSYMLTGHDKNHFIRLNNYDIIKGKKNEKTIRIMYYALRPVLGGCGCRLSGCRTRWFRDFGPAESGSAFQCRIDSKCAVIFV